MTETSADTPYLEELSAHVEKWIGPVDTVLHEIVSDTVHVDVLVIKPGDNRKCYTLVTAGMSALPQNVPEEMAMFARVELIVSLPAGNPYLLSGGRAAGSGDPPGYYPVRDLKSYARYPHVADTWLGPGHTLANGNPPEPLGEDTLMTGYLVHYPSVFDTPDAWSFEAKDGNTVTLLQMYPVYSDELDFKLKNDGDVLVDKLADAGALECFDPARPSVIKRKKPLGLF